MLPNLYSSLGAAVGVAHLSATILVCILVAVLPHECFDLYKNAVSRLTSMEKCLSDLTCKNNENTCQEIVKVSKRVYQDMEVPLPAQVMVENTILSRQEQKN